MMDVDWRKYKYQFNLKNAHGLRERCVKTASTIVLPGLTEASKYGFKYSTPRFNGGLGLREGCAISASK